MRRLIARLGLSEFQNVGPLVDRALIPQRVNIPLKQHAGAPAEPVVKSGARVREGDLLARPQAGKLGARIHASIRGVVTVMNESIAIDA